MFRSTAYSLATSFKMRLNDFMSTLTSSRSPFNLYNCPPLTFLVGTMYPFFSSSSIVLYAVARFNPVSFAMSPMLKSSSRISKKNSKILFFGAIPNTSQNAPHCLSIFLSILLCRAHDIAYLLQLLHIIALLLFNQLLYTFQTTLV